MMHMRKLLLLIIFVIGWSCPLYYPMHSLNSGNLMTFATPILALFPRSLNLLLASQIFSFNNLRFTLSLN